MKARIVNDIGEGFLIVGEGFLIASEGNEFGRCFCISVLFVNDTFFIL